MKNRGLIWDAMKLRRATEGEWDKISLDEINKAISTVPERVTTRICVVGDKSQEFGP